MGPRTFARGNLAQVAHDAVGTTGGLQWGRALSHAEIRRRGQLSGVARDASMGPRTFARGNESSQTQAASWRSFNGAAHFRTRKCQAHHRNPAGGHASMGPRTFARGNPEPVRSYWRHVYASMGPRTFARGNYDCAWNEFNVAELQWGRALSHAEMSYFWPLAIPGAQLQWGRALSHAEIIRVIMSSQAVFTASMGPRTFARGNSIRRSIHWSIQSLQWGRALSHAEIILRWP